MRRTIQRPALGTALLAACAVLALFNGPALAQEVARPLQAPPGKSGNTGEVGPTGISSPAESGRLTSVAPPPKPAPAKQPTSVIPVIEPALNETGEGTNETAISAPFETIYSGTANETNIPINVINATGGENSTSSEPSAGDIGSLSTGARRALHQLGGLVQGVQNTAGSAVSGISAALNRTIYSPVESALGSAANATGLSRLGRASGLGGGNETVAGNETLGAGNETAGLGGFNATDAGSMRGSDEQGTTTPRGNSDLTEPSGGISLHMGGGRRALQQLESLVQGVRNVQNTAGNVSGVISGGLNRTIYTPVQSALNSVADATGLSALGRALGLGGDNETMAGNETLGSGNETLGAGNETAGANSTGDGLRQSIKDLRGGSETTPGAGRRLLGAMLRDLLQSITPGTGAVDPSAAAAGTGSGPGESTGQGAQLGGGGPLSGSSRATTADRPATTGADSASGSGAGTGAGLGTGTGTGTGGINGTGDAGSGTGSSSTTGTRTSTTGTTGTTGTRSAAGVGRRLLDVMLRNLLQATGTNFDAPGDDATSGTGIGSSTGTTGPRVPGQSTTSSTGAGSGSGSAVGSGSGTGAGLGSAAGTDSGTGTRTGGVTGGGAGTGTGAGSNTGSGTGTGTGSGKERTTGTGVGGAGTSGTGTGSTGTGSTGSMGTSGGTSGSSGVGAAARAVARAATGGGSSGTSGSG